MKNYPLGTATLILIYAVGIQTIQMDTFKWRSGDHKMQTFRNCNLLLDHDFKVTHVTCGVIWREGQGYLQKVSQNVTLFDSDIADFNLSYNIFGFTLLSYETTLVEPTWLVCGAWPSSQTSLVPVLSPAAERLCCSCTVNINNNTCLQP